ncbi:MAG: hypothetical protein ACQGVC_22500 [Myxococcota bacterium]
MTALWIDLQLQAGGHAAQISFFLRAAQASGFLGCLLLVLALLGWPFQPGPTPYGIAVTGVSISALIGVVASFWLALRTAMEPGEEAE